MMKNFTAKILLAGCCAGWALSGFAAEKVFPELNQAPEIDGKVSAAEWQGAATYQLKAMDIIQQLPKIYITAISFIPLARHRYFSNEGN